MTHFCDSFCCDLISLLIYSLTEPNSNLVPWRTKRGKRSNV